LEWRCGDNDDDLDVDAGCNEERSQKIMGTWWWWMKDGDGSSAAAGTYRVEKVQIWK